jgi:HK97 family phage prohead protease
MNRIDVQEATGDEKKGAAMPTIERRYFAGEVRASAPDRSITGYAAVFNQRTELFPGMFEEILPGAFSASLSANPDVRALFNHDSNLVLGRTKSGTLAIKEDEHGLQYNVLTDPKTSIGNDVFGMVTRGDVDGSSFAFYIRDGGEQFTEVPGGMLRRVLSADVVDVSPVTYPAYEGTEASAKLAFRNKPATQESGDAPGAPNPARNSLRLARQANLELQQRVKGGRA